MDLEIRLNDWKRKLLDLGKRNGLISFKTNSKSVLKLCNPSLNEIWNKVVEQEKPLVFPYIIRSDEEDDLESYQYGEVFTNRKPLDAQKILRNLKKRYKTISDEQDVNVLYLTFGMLEWKESDSSDNYLYSPLVLVPVSLELDSIKSPFVLQIIEDEIVINPSLAYKLNHDFGLELPEYTDDDFSVIYKRLVDFAENNGWKVNDDVFVSILSFSKINMYKDLEKHKDNVLGHPIIKAFGGDDSDYKNAEQNLINYEEINNFNHDAVKPEDIFHVVDADSSQQDAILCANKNASFVLQGPPGTGKSQTITNIIASKLAEGKKVLFVSEKKAALDVVYKRLQNVGLSDFVLTLHSNKANKKETLAQLENVLTLSRNKATLSDSVRYQLDRLVADRRKLNNYAKKLNEIVQPLNKSAFYANGIISKYSDFEDISFPIPKIRDITESKYREYISVLGETTNIIKKMDDNCFLNPWKGTTVQALTHEFIHDLGENKDNIVEAVNKLVGIYEEIKKELNIECKINIPQLTKLGHFLNFAQTSPVFPKIWLDKEQSSKLLNSIPENENLQNEYRLRIGNLTTLIEQLANENSLWSYQVSDLVDSNSVSLFIESIDEIIEKDPCYSNLNKDKTPLSVISITEGNINQFNNLTSTITEIYNKDIFAIDVKAIEMRFNYSYTNFTKILKPSYWSDKKLLKNLQNNKKEKQTIIELHSLFEQISKRKQLDDEIEKSKITMLTLFPTLYKGVDTNFEHIHKELQKFELLDQTIGNAKLLKRCFERIESKRPELSTLLESRFMTFDTNWLEIRKALEWKTEFLNKCNETDIKTSEAFIVNTCISQNFIKNIEKYSSSLNEYLNHYNCNFEWFADKFENHDEILELEIKEVESKILTCFHNTNALENWIDYRTIRNKIVDLGLSDFSKIIEEKGLSSSKIIPIFEKRFFRLWLDSIYPEYPEIAQFRKVQHENTIKEFSELDKQQFDISQARIKAKLLNSLPALDSFTSGEVNILKRELAKQRRIMPIRKLFNKIPNLIMTLKPCLMMSPLSVSQFLESDCYQFDTVIFDEASQVKTENAIGAIFRGKQIIIAGDSHQLPPTNFFEVSATENEFDSDIEEEDLPLDTSILEEAIFLPSRELLWHYRSRHEHLIAFSNAKIYKNRLVTFPANKDKVPDWGVEYIYVKDGVYNGEGISRGNVKEAEKVAEEVFNHIRNYPDRTLGVIAFGVVQEAAIEAAINRKRQENPDCEPFFAEDKHEAFFVKNLENVQGDERDSIIFSIGYAKDLSGKMKMRFGPLSMVGGERRLNVAITRAKYNIKLVGSILPTDIDTERVSQEGPKLLRKYIEFAMNGMEVLTTEITDSDELDFDSPFEKSVFSFLDSQGFNVTTQVGCSGYRIDLGIKHPTLSGIYVLGIECDGATYHSSRTARERDRLRQDILEQMGWKIYRIWSTDWIKNPTNEKAKLLNVIKEAIDTYTEQTPVLENKNIDEQLEKEKSFIEIEEKQVVSNEFEKYEEYSTYARLGTDYKIKDFSEYVYKVVRLEQPVHADVIAQRLCVLIGRQKGTSVVQDAINFSYIHYLRNKITIKDDFYYLSECPDKYKVRVAGNRLIKYISIDELSKGMLQILKNSIGLTKEELLHETALAFGFNRNGSNISERMEFVFDLLVDDNLINVQEDKIILK